MKNIKPNEPLDIMSIALDIMIDCEAYIENENITAREKELFTRASDAALVIAQVMDAIEDIREETTAC